MSFYSMVVRADSLPADAYKEGNTKTVENLGLEDGDYTVEVTLEGGSGRTTVESPTELKIENGQQLRLSPGAAPIMII